MAPEIDWQVSATITAYGDQHKADKADFDFAKFRPNGLEAPKGWIPHPEKWGQWHVVSFNVQKLNSIIIVWRRCIEKQDR